MFQKLRQHGLIWLGSATLVGSASLVDCALAQYPNAYSAGTGQAPSNAVASDRPAANTSITNGQPAGATERSSLEMVSPHAQAHIDYALNLAERGAVQSAQAEFTMALDLIADALDADTHSATRAHARAIQAGMTAIEESRDFVPEDTPHDIEINLAQLASTHQTPVLRNVDTKRMSRAEALQRYHTYATQQLAFAGGRSAVASAALYGLGRAETVTIAGATTRNRLGVPNAMALFQAALLVDPQNYMASNELGVLMARFGDLDGAADQLQHSISYKPQPETWQNLATVYRRMGQLEKAELAEREREKLLTAERGRTATAASPTDLASRPALRWIDVDTFNATGNENSFDGSAVASGKPAAVSQHDFIGKRLISKLNPWPKTGKEQQSTAATEVSQKTEPSRGGEANGWPRSR